jgi:hypothetical protein
MWQEWYLSKRTPEDRIEHGGVYDYLSARCVIDVTITDSDQRSRYSNCALDLQNRCPAAESRLRPQITRISSQEPDFFCT